MSDRVIKLPAELVERLLALPVTDRATLIERALDSRLEVSHGVVAEPEASGPPAPVAQAPSVVLPESAKCPSPDDWREITFRVSPQVAEVFSALSWRVRSDVLEFCVAAARDTSHATRIGCVQFEFARVARSLRKLLKVFSTGEPRAPHLERRLRQVLHRFGCEVLQHLNEPALEMPAIGPSRAPVAPKAGVPDDYEPVVLWVPMRHVDRLAELQAKMNHDYAGQEAHWNKVMAQYAKKFVAENAPATSATVPSVESAVAEREKVEAIEGPEPQPQAQENGREATP